MRKKLATLLIIYGLVNPSLIGAKAIETLQEQPLILASAFPTVSSVPVIAQGIDDEDEDFPEDDEEWDEDDLEEDDFYDNSAKPSAAKQVVNTPAKTTTTTTTTSTTKVAPTTTTSTAQAASTTPAKTTTTTTSTTTVTQAPTTSPAANTLTATDLSIEEKIKQDQDLTNRKRQVDYVRLANTFHRSPEDFAKLYSQYGELLGGLNPDNPKDLREIEKLVEIVGIPKKERNKVHEPTLKQAPTEDPTVNFSARNIATRDAFATLARVSGKSITVSGSVQDRDSISVVEINNQPFSKAFLSLVDAADVDFRRSGDNYTILKKHGGQATSLITGFDSTDIDLSLPLEDRYADLAYDNQDLSSIIKDLANTYGVDVVMTATPTDRITLKVRGVTIEDAFELLFAGSQFNYTRKGDTFVVYSSTNKNFALDKKTVLFPLKYLAAQDANKLLPAELKSLVQVSDNQNAFIADGSKQELTQLYDFIRTIDKPIPQVELEVKLVEVTKDFAQSHNIYQSPFILGQLGRAVTTNTGGTTATVFRGFNMDFSDRNLGIFNQNPTFNQNTNNSQIKVNQRLLVTSGKSAKINFDQDINVLLNRANNNQGFAAQQQDIRRITAGNSMDITPVVGGGGVVTVKVEVEVSANNNIDNSTGVPRETIRRRISSEIQITDHETIAIGGLFDDRKGKTRTNEIPFLNKIPILGDLFANNSRNKNLKELLILITPHIRTGNDTQEIYLQADAMGSK